MNDVLSDAMLVEKLRGGSLVWADIGEYPTLCYLIESDGSERHIDPDQAERLYEAGLIDLPMPEYEWDMSFHWYLTDKGKIA